LRKLRSEYDVQLDEQKAQLRAEVGAEAAGGGYARRRDGRRHDAAGP
jgi:hypothetical protein